MTGYLHTPTGPGMIADHERRLRELERALRPKQTNLPRRLAADGLPSVILGCGTSTVTPPGETLEWTAPEVNVGGAFTYDAGFPGVVTVVASSLLLVTVHLKVTPVDSTWQRLILSGFGSGAASTEMVQHESGDTADTPEMVRVVQANAGVALEVMLDHNGSLAMTITKGDLTVTRLWSL